MRPVLRLAKQLVHRNRQRTAPLAGGVMDRVGHGRSRADHADLAYALDAQRRNSRIGHRARHFQCAVRREPPASGLHDWQRGETSGVYALSDCSFIRRREGLH